MNSRLQKILKQRSLIKKRTNGMTGKSKGSDDESNVEQLVDEQEGLKTQLAMKIQGYGSLVWNSIKDRSNRRRVTLDGVFIVQKTQADCYIFIGLALNNYKLIM